MEGYSTLPEIQRWNNTIRWRLPSYSKHPFLEDILPLCKGFRWRPLTPTEIPQWRTSESFPNIITTEIVLYMISLVWLFRGTMNENIISFWSPSCFNAEWRQILFQCRYWYVSSFYVITIHILCDNYPHTSIVIIIKKHIFL